MFYKNHTFIISILLSLPISQAQGYDQYECWKNGCSIKECGAAYQNGYTCKKFKCFLQCMSLKGFPRPCPEYAYSHIDYKNCESTHYTCERQCKYEIYEKKIRQNTPVVQMDHYVSYLNDDELRAIAELMAKSERKAKRKKDVMARRKVKHKNLSQRGVSVSQHQNPLDALADKIFWKRHPALRGRKLTNPQGKLAQEWAAIRRCEAIVDYRFYQRFPQMRGRTIEAEDTAMIRIWTSIRDQVPGCF